MSIGRELEGLDYERTLDEEEVFEHFLLPSFLYGYKIDLRSFSPLFPFV